MEQTKIYSPNQVGLLSFICGPLVPVFFLYRNFLALDEPDEAKKILIFGGLSVLLLLTILSFLPDSFPNMVIPIAYSITGRTIAESMQMNKEAIEESAEHTFQSNWKATGMAVVMLLIALILAFVIAVGLYFTGFLVVPA